MASRQYATFEVADQLFGLEVAMVQEVLSFHEYTPVPLAPRSVGGLFNLRGQVIAAVDLRVQLGLQPRDFEGPAMNVIVRTPDESVSLLVDRIGEVVELDDETFEPPPDTLTGPSRELITGAFKLDGRLMLALDTGRAVQTSIGSAVED
ncbi:chemotaxis protein CheW [Planosporangium mesophilum]|uniref:Chemotaxis protein CheW n=1 Tax=Planosporangium mesophilum TaxID=689768 RepID=A0A8J3X418_9ACTN|nr:chemotaxis protein CheW [Planosporangium mesophilum]NJC86539.1 chemotaxis protein CheW [Planosporangium mesophilum]GII26134.1 chemotaxis protein CheW [Planosporangium mesophilum]